MRFQPLSAVGLVCALLACSSSSDDGEPKDVCSKGTIREGDACVLDPFRWEPDEQLDQDNVVYYSGEPFEILTDLPDPPKSGFRLVMDPRVVPAGAESEQCHTWAIPDIESRWVYTAVLHTTPGLHHANIFGLPIDSVKGPEPSPGCTVNADSRIFGQIYDVVSTGDTSNVLVPVVLFANSTQVVGTNAERYALAEGYAYELPANTEVSTSIHLQNTAPEDVRVEAVWDFYTMPASEVSNPTAMFVDIFLDFLIPPRSPYTLTATCAWDGGEIAAIMPHTHQWATGFDVKFGEAPLRELDGEPELGGLETTMLTAYERSNTGLRDSDIEVYLPPLDTSGASAVQFQCHFDNTTDHDMCFGIGENEMCFLFGYVSPPEKQRVGIILTEGATCLSLSPAEKGKMLNIGDWIQSQPVPVREKVAALYGRGEQTCPYQQ